MVDAYLGFWRRLGAWAIDFAIVLALLLAGLAVGLVAGGESLFLGFVVGLTALWLYFAGFDSSPRQTTLGGRAVGARVTGLQGERLTFGRATLRHFAMYASALTPFAIGYLMVLWTKRRQALHDYLTSSVVVRSP